MEDSLRTVTDAEACDAHCPGHLDFFIPACDRTRLLWSALWAGTRLDVVGARSNFGEITAVVNCVGIMPLAPIQKGDLEAFDRVIATNLRGSFLVMSEAANHVADDGRIITFSSSVLGKNFPAYGAYIASKAGVEGLTRVLANELGQRKITVNAVAPGPVATELFLKGKSEDRSQELANELTAGNVFFLSPMENRSI